ncbi:MAG TPA: cell division protein FtsL [Gammaproteobacteria bacterium]|nr:cell division protein FtsL [Gammaproteobacteria bacterium]
MNAAARALTQGIVIAASPAHIRAIALSRQAMTTFLLVFAIVISALSVITLSDSNRKMVGELSSLQHDRNLIQTEYGQLLLEKNTWVAPSRVERAAKQDDGLVFPNAQKVVIIHP